MQLVNPCIKSLDSMEASLESLDKSESKLEIKLVRDHPGCQTFTEVDKKTNRHSVLVSKYKEDIYDQENNVQHHSISKLLSQVEDEEIINRPSDRLDKYNLLSPK